MRSDDRSRECREWHEKFSFVWSLRRYRFLSSSHHLFSSDVFSFFLPPCLPPTVKRKYNGELKFPSNVSLLYVYSLWREWLWPYFWLIVVRVFLREKSILDKRQVFRYQTGKLRINKEMLKIMSQLVSCPTHLCHVFTFLIQPLMWTCSESYEGRTPDS